MEGARTLLVEKNPSFDAPVTCGEFIPSIEEARSLMPSVRGLSEFYRFASTKVTNTTSSVIAYGPSGKAYEFRFHGLVLDKCLLNGTLASVSKGAGAEAITSCLVQNVNRDRDHVKILATTPNGPRMMEAKAVVGADGFPSVTALSAGLKAGFSADDLALCLNSQMTGVKMDERTVEMYFGNMVAPGGYAWIIPRGNGVANVGLGVRLSKLERSENLQERLNTFREKHPMAALRLLNAKALRYSVKTVPVGGIARQICEDRILLAGDSAGAVVPINGGGILTAAISGRIAGEEVASFVLGESDLSGYQESINNEISYLIRRGLAYRKAADHVMKHDALFDTVLSMLGQNYVAKIVQCRPSLLLELLKLL
jgi:digeranylgeranylglycerophospholipid reductase